MKENYPYSIDRFIKLLKKEAYFRKKNKPLVKSEYTELLRYKVVLYDYVCWKNRNEILKLMKKFRNDEISLATFDTEFFELWRFNRDLTQFIEENVKLINLIEIDPRSRNCALIVSNLMSYLEFLYERKDEDDDDDEENGENSQEETSNEMVRSLIEEAYQELLKY